MLNMATNIAARKLRLQSVFSIAVLILIICNGAVAQQNGCTERTIPLTIGTANPNSIALSTADLEGSYSGKAVQIGSLFRQRPNLASCILLRSAKTCREPAR